MSVLLRLNPFRTQRCVSYTRYAPEACRTFLQAAVQDAQQAWADRLQHRSPSAPAPTKIDPRTLIEADVSTERFSIRASRGRSAVITSGRFGREAGQTRVEIKVSRDAISNLLTALAFGWALVWAWLWARAGLQSPATTPPTWLILLIAWLLIGVLPLLVFLLVRRQPEDEPTGLNLVRQALDLTDVPATTSTALTQ